MGHQYHNTQTRHTPRESKLYKNSRNLTMGEAIDGCTAFNLALCVAIAWGVPEYLSADCFNKFAFFYPVYASLRAVGGNGCVKNWSCFWVYCMHPKFNGASQFAGQFLGPVLNLVQQHL